MGNSFACISSQKAKTSKNLSSKASHELQYLDSEQLSVLNSLNNLKKMKKKKKKKAELKRNDCKANSRSVSSGEVSRIRMVLTKEEAALLLLKLISENDDIGGVSFGFCGGLGSHEWKPSLQSIEEEDEFC